MGATFHYVLDGALAPCGGEQCHQCERGGVPVYAYFGRIIDPALAANPDLARREPDVDELCAACILGGNVRKSDGVLRELVPTIEALAADAAAAVEAFHRTPDLPFLQRQAWPICCGDWTEYLGDRPTPETGLGDYEPWRPGSGPMARYRLEDFYPLEELPVLHTMALFRCPCCAKGYWVFQYSGLTWPGPVAGRGR